MYSDFYDKFFFDKFVFAAMMLTQSVLYTTGQCTIEINSLFIVDCTHE